MTLDSKEKILADWNSKILEEPKYAYSHLSIFSDFDDLYRYLLGVSKGFGHNERKRMLNHIDKVVAPRSTDPIETVKIRKEQKSKEAETTTNILMFLKRAKALKKLTSKTKPI